MNKYIKPLVLSVLILSIPGVVFGIAAYDIGIQQRNPTNTATLLKFVPIPAGGANGVVMLDGSSIEPVVGTVGSGLSWTAGTLSVSGINMSDISGLNTAMSAKQDTIATGTASQYMRGDLTLANFPVLSTVATSGLYADLSGKPSLATVATSGSYNDLTNKPTIPASQIQSDWTQTSTTSLDYIKNKPAARSQSSASRTLNSCFQISSTRDVLANYSVDIAATLSLTGGMTGTVFLEIYSDSGCTTGTQELSRFVNGNTGTLTIGLNITQNATGGLTGYVPAGSYVKIRTANTAGTPTFTYRSGQEVQL